MPFEYKLESLCRLSEVTERKHLKSLSHAQYPGTHCPLFGTALAACEIEGLEVLVVGTDECTYYTKAFAIDRVGAGNRFWSYAMEHGDIVFGAGENVRKAIAQIGTKTNPQAILLVTTCVPEITGEDYDAIAQMAESELGIPVLTVHTEHFRCNSHIPGIENTLTALAALMERQPIQEKRLNLLGHRFGSIESSELMCVLRERGYFIGLTLPSRCDIQDIRVAPAAELNIVTDFTALSLAERMKAQFGTPFVVFDKYLNPRRIRAAYDDLENVLNIQFGDELSGGREKLTAYIDEARKTLTGKTFVYGNSVLSAFEVVQFLCELGMTPLIVQARDLYRNDDVYIREILETGNDPYVSGIANIAPLRTLYPKLRPNFYIGHENPHELARHGISQVTFDAAASRLGYELASGVLETLLDSARSGANPLMVQMGGMTR